MGYTHTGSGRPVDDLNDLTGYEGPLTAPNNSPPSPTTSKDGGGRQLNDYELSILNQINGYNPGGSGDSAAAETKEPDFSSYESDYEKNKYEYTPYDPAADAGYQAALGKLNEIEKPSYAGTYDATLQGIYDDILGRDKFKYDLNSDELYRQYRDQYVLHGQQAMMDTQGQAAALTGGYGSSYGQAVGQQQYNAQLQKLNDIVPQLRDRAYQEWQTEGEQKLKEYALTKEMSDSEYSRYRDALNSYINDRSYLTDRADTAFNQNYKLWSEDQALRKQMSDTEYAKLAAEAESMAQYGDFSGYAKMYGDEIAKNMFNAWKYTNPQIAQKLGYAV